MLDFNVSGVILFNFLEEVLEMGTENVVIIGSGPAGYTAAIYAARADLAPLLFEGVQPGGQLAITTDVENYPGFPEGILGPDLMNNMKKQAERFGTRIVFEEVVKVNFNDYPFTIITDKDREVYAKSVIIATGAAAKKLGVPGEEELLGFGVSMCATCDGFFFKGKELVVVGGGDSALEEAIYLTKFSPKVTIVHRRDKLRASKILQKRAFNNPKIEWIWSSVVTEIIGTREKGVEAVKIKNLVEDKEYIFSTQGVFIAIGHLPNTSIFRGQLDMDDKGYIKVNHPYTYTSVEGVFAAGDVVDYIYRQAVTAAGMGCKAAIDAERFLESRQ